MNARFSAAPARLCCKVAPTRRRNRSCLPRILQKQVKNHSRIGIVRLPATPPAALHSRGYSEPQPYPKPHQATYHMTCRRFTTPGVPSDSIHRPQSCMGSTTTGASGHAFRRHSSHRPAAAHQTPFVPEATHRRSRRPFYPVLRTRSPPWR